MTSGARLHPSDAWVECACGERHWGTHGAAGLLLTDGERVVLQHRAEWSHHGGTWGIPGGALHPGESAARGALRESTEEAGVDAAAVRLLASSALVHPDWSYTTVLAAARGPLDPHATDPESLEVAWVADDDVATLPLHPAFATAWPDLRPLLDARPLLVVDAANVVGSVPDGWWRDRRAAATRLRDGLLASLDAGLDAALLGLPGLAWWPDVVLVLEGAARGVLAAHAPAHGWAAGSLSVLEAAGSGDDAIVDAVAGALDDGARRAEHVTVATADRGLIARLPSGVRVVGPRRVRDLARPD